MFRTTGDHSAGGERPRNAVFQLRWPPSWKRISILQPHNSGCTKCYIWLPQCVIKDGCIQCNFRKFYWLGIWRKERLVANIFYQKPIVNVNVNVLHLYSAICIPSEALLVNHLYSAPSQGRLRQCRLGFEHDTLRLLPLPPYAGT